jgi:hypothetical protein
MNLIILDKYVLKQNALEFQMATQSKEEAALLKRHQEAFSGRKRLMELVSATITATTSKTAKLRGHEKFQTNNDIVTELLTQHLSTEAVNKIRHKGQQNESDVSVLARSYELDRNFMHALTLRLPTKCTEPTKSFANNLWHKATK